MIAWLALSAVALRVPTVSMTAAAASTDVALSVEEALSLFGRLADDKHVFEEPIRTAASGFEFSANTAIKPKWLIGYVTREPCGEDVDGEVHCTRWSELLFPDGAEMCTREKFDAALCSAAYVAPLGAPKWSIPGKALVDTKASAATPTPAALDALWAGWKGAEAGLERDAVVERLRAWAKSDDLGEAVLFSEFAAGLKEA